MFGTVKLTKNANPDKYSYWRYGIGFDSRSLFLFPNFNWGQNVISFGVDNSSSVHIYNTKKDIVVFGNGPTQGVDDTAVTAAAEYSIKFCLCLHYDGSNSFLFVNANSKQKVLK